MQLHVVKSVPADNSVNFVVAVPPTRSDILHPCDVAEVFFYFLFFIYLIFNFFIFIFFVLIACEKLIRAQALDANLTLLFVSQGCRNCIRIQ